VWERERLREQESKREHRWFHVLETLPGYAFYEWRIKSNTAATELPDDNHTSTSQQILPTYYHRTRQKLRTPAHTTVFLITHTNATAAWRSVTECSKYVKVSGYIPLDATAFLQRPSAVIRLRAFYSTVHPFKEVVSCGAEWGPILNECWDKYERRDRGHSPQKASWKPQ